MERRGAMGIEAIPFRLQTQGRSLGRVWVSARLRTLYHSQKVMVAAMQMAEKKVWAQRS